MEDMRKSVTPPRPILPDNYVKEISPIRHPSPSLMLVSKRGSVEEPLPPRPPPPFLYTSTLPPPAPKKQRSKSNDFRSKTLPVRRSHSQSKPAAKETQNTPLESVSSDECSSLNTPSTSQLSVTLMNTRQCTENIDNSTSDSQTKTTSNISDVQANETKYQCQSSSQSQETVFFTSFRKASQSPPVNSLKAIGETGLENLMKENGVNLAVVSANGMKNSNTEMKMNQVKDDLENNDKDQEKMFSNCEDKRKRKKQDIDNKISVTVDIDRKSCSPPSKRSSIENVKNISNVSGNESKTTKAVINKTNSSSLKQQPNASMNMTNSSPQQMKNSKHPVAPESLASRAKHESQEQLKKFKKNVSMDECKTKSSVLHTKPDCHDSKLSATRSVDRASSSSNSSISSLSEDKKHLKNIQQQSHRMSPVLAIKNIMKKSDKDSKRKKSSSTKTGCKKEAPIVLEDKYNKVLIKSGQRSPTPSLASSSTSTLTDSSSYAPSNLSLLSELLSDKDYQTWLSSGIRESKNNFKGIEDLDKYVFDMIASTQDIQSPRASQINKSKKSSKEFDELIKILNFKKRHSTNLEMKKSLQVIIDFIGDKKQNYVNPQKVLKLSFASEMKIPERRKEEVGDCFMDCPSEEQVAKMIIEDEKLNLFKIDTETKVFPMITIASPPSQEYRPIPSPRMKRKNRIDGSSPTPSSISSCSKLVKSDSRVSITSFNSLIQDLCQHTAGVEERVQGSNIDTKDQTYNTIWLHSMKEKMESLISEKEKNKNMVEEYRLKLQKYSEINVKHEMERDDWNLKENDMKLKIKDLMESLQKQSCDLEALCEQNSIKSKEIQLKDSKLISFENKLQEKDQVVTSKKKEINDQQVAINSLNDLVIKLNEDIDKLKTKQSQNKLETNEIKMLKESNEKFKLEHGQMKCAHDKLKFSFDSLHKEVELFKENEIRNKFKEKEYKDQISYLTDDKEKLIQTHKRVIEHLEHEISNERLKSEDAISSIKYLEDKIEKLEDNDKDEVIIKLRSDLKRRGILLKDAQSLVSKLQNENHKKSMIKQMRDQIEDLEGENLSLSRAKKNLENDLEEIKSQLDDMSKSKKRVEEKYLIAMKENSSLSNQLEDTEEELQELLKKYKASVTTISTDQIMVQEQSFTIIELEHENERLKEKNSDLSYKIEQLETDKIDISQHKNAKMKITELEQKLDLELTNKFRLEHQADRLRDNVTKLEKEADLEKFKYQADQEKHKKLLNQFRDLKEDYLSLQGKESDMTEKNSNLHKKIEIAESENIILKKDLELAMKRIEDFHTAISSEIDSDSDTITCSDDDIFVSRQSLISGSIAQEIMEFNMNKDP